MSKRLGEQGLVMLRVWVSAEGLPKQGQIKKSSGYERLDQAALQALAKWRFAPGKRNGQPEGMWYEVPLNFVLENRVMSENFGVTHLWAQADWVARAVVLLLLLMSLASWSVILTKAWSIVRHKRQARATEKFWHSQDIQAGLAQLGAQADDPFRALAMTGVEAKAHHRAAHAQLHDSMDVSDWVERCLRNAIDDSTTRLQAGLAILASVGATAPFVGLFGTVWGIYQALMTMGIAGQASLDKIAGPIGETLVMTALGLAVAIPAVLGYNALTRGNRFVLTKLNRFANDLHAYFVTGSRLQYEGHANRDRQAGSR
jgi:biopolymer transport protein ExbB